MNGTAQTWADLGCGAGLFTKALASILPAESIIYAIDKTLASFRIKSIPGKIKILPMEFDFMKDAVTLENLDGILMANALHFVRDKSSFLEKTQPWFRSKSGFLIVEYDTDNSNPYVPYPMSFKTLNKFFTESGYGSVIKLSEKPSLYHSGNIYSAIVTQ